MNFKGKDCVSPLPKHLAGMDERVDNSCKRRAEYLRCSLVIVHIQCSQWQAAFITREVSVLADVSVTEQVLQEISKFPEILGMHKQCVPGSFLPAHAREPGNKARVNQALHSHTASIYHCK